MWYDYNPQDDPISICYKTGYRVGEANTARFMMPDFLESDLSRAWIQGFLDALGDSDSFEELQNAYAVLHVKLPEEYPDPRA